MQARIPLPGTKPSPTRIVRRSAVKTLPCWPSFNYGKDFCFTYPSAKMEGVPRPYRQEVAHKGRAKSDAGGPRKTILLSVDGLVLVLRLLPVSRWWAELHRWSLVGLLRSASTRFSRSPFSIVFLHIRPPILHLQGLVLCLLLQFPQNFGQSKACLSIGSYTDAHKQHTPWMIVLGHAVPQASASA